MIPGEIIPAKEPAFLDANPIAGDVYDYHCHPHGFAGMVGSITVAPDVPMLSNAGLALLGSAFLAGAVFVSKRRRASI